MASKKRSPSRKRPPARSLCRHFKDTELAGCARAGLEVLETDHKPIVQGADSIGCGVALDRCRQPREPDAPRWDYLFTMRDGDIAIGVEVHHAVADEVDLMIRKKEWATNLLAEQCPALKIGMWLWLASPPNGEIFFTPQNPAAHRLADAGIQFPRKRVTLP